MSEGKANTRFTNGAIEMPFHERPVTEAGALAVFYGIIRPDTIHNERVSAIEYSAYRPHADRLLHQLAGEQILRFGLETCTIIHSLGVVPVASASMYVSCSALHRQAALEALHILVDRIKAEVPVWGKEHFESGGYQWKKNKMNNHEQHHP